jgi:hypothetical protein
MKEKPQNMPGQNLISHKKIQSNRKQIRTSLKPKAKRSVQRENLSEEESYWRTIPVRHYEKIVELFSIPKQAEQKNMTHRKF